MSSNSQYGTLNGGHENPTVQSLQQQHPQYFTDDDDDDDTLIERGNVHEEANSIWWRTKRPQLTSGYLTLIPLSDSRLKPRNTRLIIGAAILLCVASVCIVFFTVARGVTVGTIEVVNSTISFSESTLLCNIHKLHQQVALFSFHPLLYVQCCKQCCPVRLKYYFAKDTSAGTYSIMLKSQLPIYNPNYASVLLTGRIKVSFYDQSAGYADLNPVLIHARAQVVHKALIISGQVCETLLTF
jgi:hypothetical protein